MSTGILNTAPGPALVNELIAASRAVAKQQAVLMAKLVAVADATSVAEFASYEISTALTWTRQAATVQLDLATDMVRRLPDVHAAMASGRIDLPRARVIRDAVAALDLALARRIAATILPLAPTLTTGKLQTRLAKLVIEADPDAAAKRRQTRLRERRVVLQPAEDSCANVFGLNLPADTALEASNRINAIARAVKQAGDPRSLDQLRADTFLDLLLGNATATATRTGGVEVVAPLDTLTRLTNNPGHLNGYGAVIADIARQVAEQQRHAPWTFTIHDDATGDIHTGTIRTRPADKPAFNDPGGTPTRAHPMGKATRTRATDNPRRAHPTGKPGRPRTTDTPHQAHPKDKPAQPRATDTPRQAYPTGKPSKPGQPRTTDTPRRAHPTGKPSKPGQPRTTDTPRRAHPTGKPSKPGQPRTTGTPHQAHPTDKAEQERRSWADTRAAGTSTASTAPGLSRAFGDPGRRFPNAALARHIRARDRTCRAPGCRRPASQADLDHTIAFEAGGRTVRGNLGVLCRFHHRAKHEGGWELHQIAPGIFIWRSPLGKLYIVRPEPP